MTTLITAAKETKGWPAVSGDSESGLSSPSSSRVNCQINA